jgi:hypothetical protein
MRGDRMALPIVFDTMNNVLMSIQINEIVEMNEETAKYRLTLTVEEAKEIIEIRNHILESYGRIEIDTIVTKKFIQRFYTSPLINQEDYATIINELHEIYYYLKNETEDKIGDDELIDLITGFFNNSCGGSIELLRGREMEIYSRNIRCKNQLEDYLSEKEELEWY